MKRIHLLSLLLLFPVFSHAQYQSVFGKKSTSWNVLTEIIDGVRTDSISCTSDSVLNGKTYKVVKHLRGNAFLCFMREDTVVGKVWVLRKDSELLAMDMALQENDLFPFAVEISNGGNDYLPVKRIYNRNRLKYIGFEPTTTEDSTYFIEGIGPTIGFFYKIDSGLGYYYFGMDDYLLCAYKDGQRVYTNNSIRPEVNGKCLVYIVGLKEKAATESRVTIFPDPSASVIAFQFRNEKSITTVLMLYNQSGQFMESTSSTGNILQVSKGNKAAGIYYYRLLQQGQLISAGKIEFTP